jgi:hypothetical protein
LYSAEDRNPCNRTAMDIPFINFRFPPCIIIISHF